MYGSLIGAFVEAIRAFPDAAEYGLYVIQVNDGSGKAVINANLPCVAVSLYNAKRPVTFIGGGVYEQPRVTVQVIIDFVNHSSSPDGGVAVKFQNLPYEIRRWVEKSINDTGNEFFASLRAEHGFSAVLDEVKTYETWSQRLDMQKFPVLCYSFTWICNALDPQSVEQNSVTLASVTETLND